MGGSPGSVYLSRYSKRYARTSKGLYPGVALEHACPRVFIVLLSPAPGVQISSEIQVPSDFESFKNRENYIP